MTDASGHHDSLRTEPTTASESKCARTFSATSSISKLEHAEDVRVSTLRQYLEGLGARLELVAVFDDEERRVPIHLGPEDREPAA